MVIVNLQPTKHDKKCNLKINTYVDKVMERLCDLLEIKIPKFETPHYNLKSIHSKSKERKPNIVLGDAEMFKASLKDCALMDQANGLESLKDGAVMDQANGLESLKDGAVMDHTNGLESLKDGAVMDHTNGLEQTPPTDAVKNKQNICAVDIKDGQLSNDSIVKKECIKSEQSQTTIEVSPTHVKPEQNPTDHVKTEIVLADEVKTEGPSTGQVKTELMTKPVSNDTKTALVSSLVKTELTANECNKSDIRTVGDMLDSVSGVEGSGGVSGVSGVEGSGGVSETSSNEIHVLDPSGEPKCKVRKAD
jgi:hypothetical protein